MVRWAKNQLVSTAREIGEVSLSTQIRDGAHAANGLTTVRWGPGVQYDYGYEGYLSASDTNYLSGWAWIALFEHIRDDRYLKAAELLAESTKNLMDRFDLIPQDYVVSEQTWAFHTLSESGFGMEGLSELYRVTGKSEHAQIAVDYIEQHLDKLLRPDGLWERMWVRPMRFIAGQDHLTHVRGQGWGMMGLQAAYRVTGDKKYLSFAVQMADHIQKWQHPSGCWSLLFDKPVGEVGVAEKGTAVWCFLLYRLYALTNDTRYLESARKALNWAIENQYFGNDPHAIGSIVGFSALSGLVYRPWTRMSCTYTSAYFGLAALQELGLGRRE